MADDSIDILLRLQDELSPALAKAQAAIKDAAAGLAGVNNTNAQSFRVQKEATDDSIESFMHGIPIVGEFIAALSAERVAEFVAASVEAASRIEDLSRATGVSIDSFQRLSYVGKEFGVDAEQMARGVEQLSSKLANGDANAVKAVQMLGFSVDELIAKGPTEAFLEVADATGRVQDPMLKAALATDEFGGRLAKVLLPALGELREKMDAVPKGAILSDQNVVSAHELDVAWTHLKDIWGNVFVDLIVRTGEAFGSQTKEMREAAKAAGEHQTADIQLISSSELLNNRLKALRTEAMMPLSDTQKGAIVELESYGVSQKEIAQLLQTSEISVKRYTDSLSAQEKAVKAAAAAEKEYDDVLAHMDKETFTLAMEHEKQWREERLATMQRVNTAVLAEFDAQVKLNAEWGLNAAGAVQVQSSALDILNQKLAALHATRIEGISQEKQEQVLLDEYTKALYDDAVAQDAVAASTAKVSDASVSAGDKFKSFTNTLVLGVSDLDDVNAALSAFYDQLSAFGGVGSMGGSNGVGAASGGGPSGPRVPGQGLQTRDAGGPVVAGQPYYIGRGAQPELFIPSTNGTMIPNGAGGSTTIYVTAPQGTDPHAFAQAIDDALTARQRNTGQRL